MVQAVLMVHQVLLEPQVHLDLQEQMVQVVLLVLQEQVL